MLKKLMLAVGGKNNKHVRLQIAEVLPKSDVERAGFEVARVEIGANDIAVLETS